MEERNRESFSRNAQNMLHPPDLIQLPRPWILTHKSIYKPLSQFAIQLSPPIMDFFPIRAEQKQDVMLIFRFRSSGLGVEFTLHEREKIEHQPELLAERGLCFDRFRGSCRV
jgi:hypothetical protein